MKTPEELGISQEQLNNLVKLAAYLEKPNRPEGKTVRFNMAYFSDGEDEDLTCGTAGCAIGHGPFAGIKKNDAQSWRSYCENFVPDNQNEKFSWMFSGHWAVADNTIEGAAKRIRWFIENGVPSNYDKQMHNAAKLCYI